MRTLVLSMLSLLVAACPETAGQQCPPNAVPVGNYSLSFKLEKPADACLVTLDGGTKAQVGANASQAATVCTGPADDGGVLIWLWVLGKQPRPSDLLVDGGFQFRGGTSDPTPGTACVCSVTIDELFAGNLVAAGDAGFALLPDGGLPPVSGLAGSDSQRITQTGTGCACEPSPCQVLYSVTGSRF